MKTESKSVGRKVDLFDKKLEATEQKAEQMSGKLKEAAK